MKAGRFQIDGMEFGVADFDARWVVRLVQLCADPQPGAGGCIGDQLDDDLMAGREPWRSSRIRA